VRGGLDLTEYYDEPVWPGYGISDFIRGDAFRYWFADHYFLKKDYAP
jgi:acetyl esterase/lipase